MASTGLEVAITELDIRVPDGSGDDVFQTQKEDYTKAVGACMAIEKCVGVSVWGVSDSTSWIPGVFPGEGAALLFDDDLNKKPAYDGAIEGIGAAAAKKDRRSMLSRRAF
jgi:endo-1,4-beta-xylanase